MIKSKKVISSFDDQDEKFFSTFNLVHAKKFAPDLDQFPYLILLYVKLRSFFFYSFYYYYYFFFSLLLTSCYIDTSSFEPSQFFI